MTRMVGVKALFQSGIEAGELAGKNVRRQPHEFWQFEVKLNQQIGRGPRPRVARFVTASVVLPDP